MRAMRHGRARSLLVLVVLLINFPLLLAALPRTAHAQIGGGGGCILCDDDTTPPVAFMTPGGGTFTASPTISVTIEVCDDESPVVNPSLTFNGAGISGFSFSHVSDPGCGAPSSLSVYKATGSLTLNPGGNTLVVDACDQMSNCADYQAFYTYSPPPPTSLAVTPDGGTVPVTANTSTTKAFTIASTGGPAAGVTYTLSATCTGTASCASTSVSPHTVTILSGHSASGTVSYSVGGDGTTGTVQLTATYNASIHDAGSVTVSAQAPCQVADASLSPCGGNLGTVVTNTTGSRDSLQLTNNTGFPLSYTLACTPSGAVASCTASGDGGLNAGESGWIRVTANATSTDGDGTAHLTLTTGSGQQVAGTFDLEVLSPTSVVVSTSTTTTHLDAGSSGSHEFTVHNAGHLAETFQLTPVCTGMVTQCVPSATQVTLAAQASSTISVSYVGGSSGGTGTVGLRATHIRSSAVTSMASAPVAEDRTPATVALTPYDGEAFDPARCVASCFAATASYTTPAYTSVDVARAVTLVYSSTAADPRPIVQVDVVDPSAIQANTFSLKLKQPGGGFQTFANGSQEMFFTNAHATRRMAVQFDPSIAVGTGDSTYTLIVTSSWDGTTQHTDIPIHVLMDNEQASPYGAGWSIAGLERLSTLGDSVVILDGTGAMSLFRRQGCSASTCTYASPAGDFTTVTSPVTVGTDGIAYTRRTPDGTTVAFTQDGREAYVEDRFGTKTTFGYDTANRLSTITDPVGKIITLHYDTAGKLDYILDPMGRKTLITINASGDLTQIHDPAGGVPLTATYDTRHRLTSLTDRAGTGHTANFAYDFAGKVDSVTLPTITVDGQSVRPIVQYGSLAKAVLPALGVGSAANPALGVDTSDIRASITDPRGNVTRYAINRFAEATRTEEPLGRVTTMTYDAEGHLTATTAPSGHTMGYRWIGPDLIQTTDSTTGQTIHISYESTYHEVATISGDATPVTNYWSAGKLDSALVGGSMSHFTYDSAGRLLTSTDPLAHETSTSYATSGLRNRISVTAAGRTTSFTPDAYGRVVTTTAPNDAVVTTVYDPLNRVQQVIGPLPDTTVYTYGDSLHLTKVRDAKHQTYESTFNALGWVESTEDPTHHTSTVAYDLVGNAVQTTDPAGHVVTTHYNALNQADTVTADGQKTTYSTDSLGRFVATSNAASTDTIFFDVAGRPISEVTVRDSQRYVRSSTYDSLGLRTALTASASKISAPWSATIRYHYDPVAHQLDTLTDVAGGKTALDYNPDRLATTVKWPTSTGLTVSTTYPSTHTPSQVSYSSAALDSALGASYSYTTNELLAQRIPTHQAGDGSVAGREFQYDSLGQLVGYDDYHLDPGEWQDICGTGHRVDADGNPCFVPVPGAKRTTNIHAFPYDKVGNRTDSGAVTDSANRLLQFGDNVLTYDSDGNLIERSRTTDGFDQTYSWNSLGQLVSVTTNGATVSFAYDGFGRRVSKATASGTTGYLYDGDNLLAELDGAGNRVAEYTYYPGVDQPLSVRRWVGGVASTYYYATDLANNVVGLVNSSNTLVDHYVYTPFGALEDSSGTVPNNLRFGAREFDQETGLYYNRARYYDPTLGRFISEDPIGLAGGINLYVYAGNDPLNAIDPYGLYPCETETPQPGEAVLDCVQIEGDAFTRNLLYAIAWDAQVPWGSQSIQFWGDDGDNGAGTGGESSGGPQNAPKHPWACTADGLINVGLDLVPELTVPLLAMNALGVSFHPIETIADGGMNPLRVDHGGLVAAVQVATAGKTIGDLAFWTAGGEAALARATELAGRRTAGVKEANRLAEVGKMARLARFAGYVARGVNVVSALKGLHDCWHP